MNFFEHIQQAVADFIRHRSGTEIVVGSVAIGPTRKDFEGDYTIVVFPYIRYIKGKPEDCAQMLGEYLLNAVNDVSAFNVVKGFLNLKMTAAFWSRNLLTMRQADRFGHRSSNGEKVLVEYSSPNTNKPLHLGHIRNIALGWSCARILEAVGYDVVKTQIVNDRGIAICKSMLAWKLFANGATPASTNTKSDHFVGQYYIEFERRFQEEYKHWQMSKAGRAAVEQGKRADQSAADFFKAFKNQYFNAHSDLGRQARTMLIDWENGDDDVRALWSKLNQWVYDGFEETYRALGVGFDCSYYESDTYLLGKESVQHGLAAGTFYKKDDGSVWADLESAGLDQKIIVRSDGTSVYITQDLGTAEIRYADHGVDRMVYVVGDEQDYHFKVLFEVLKRLGAPYADGLYHLSYGMVDLPSGKMKSREGTVVDADDLIAEVIREARQSSEERGALSDLTDAERALIYRQVGLAALKFFIIKVHPKKRMLFDPKESVDMQGQTGPYVQNAYVRIRSIIRKHGAAIEPPSEVDSIQDAEKEVLQSVMDYPDVVMEAAEKYDPSLVANFAYRTAKAFHKMYHDVRILGAESDDLRQWRLGICALVANVLEDAMFLLGIEMPQRM